MYRTTDNYKNKIYDPSTKHLLKVFINDIEIDKRYILDCTPSFPLFSNDEFALGSVVSLGMELKLYKSAIPDSINSIYITSGIDGEEVPIGYYRIDEISNNDDYTATLKLLDDMIKFEFNYDGSSMIDDDGSAEIIEVVKDICLKAKVELGSTSFLNMHQKISVYDNTKSARTYLSYIAEQAGGFAIIGRDGKLYIKTIGESIVKLPLKYFKNFSWGDKCKISRIRYEDGIQLFEKGDTSGNTIYINQENMYIINQEQIDNIYEKLNGLEVYSFEGESIIDPAIDVGDLLLIDNKYVIFQGSSKYSGKWIASISSKIQCKAKEETMSKTVSEKQIIRDIQSSINQEKQTIKQLIKKTDENTNQVTQFKQSLNGIKGTVENSEKDVTEIKKKAIYSVEVLYAQSTSQTLAPTEDWSTESPKYEKGKYIWQKTVTTYADGSKSESNAICISGSDGIGVKETKVEYQESSSGITPPSSWSLSIPSVSAGSYLWTRTTLIYTDDSKTYSYSVSYKATDGKAGEKGIGIKETNISYQASSDGVNIPTGNWSKNVPSVEDGQFLWTKTELIYTDESKKYSYSVSKMGVGIEQITPQYYLSNSNTNQTGGQWKDYQEEWKEGLYYWTRSKIDWSDGNTTYTEPVLNTEINDINERILETTKHFESTIEQKEDEIIEQVKEMQNFLRGAEGTSQILLTNTPNGQGYVQEFNIKGNTNYFKYLVPASNLTPSNSLVPMGDHITIVCDIQSRTSKSSEAVEIDVKLKEPLRSHNSVYDELNIIDSKAVVTRRVGVNSSGTLYSLSTPTTEDLGEVRLTTFETNTYIYIKEYTNLNYVAKYIIKNDYTDKFITKTEAQSRIDQKSDSITETVSRTYATKDALEEEKTERIQTTNEISQVVSGKVGEKEFGTKIQQSATDVQIAWNSISRYIKFIDAMLKILDTNNNLLMTLNEIGLYFYNNNINTGFIGTNYYEKDPSQKGLVFNLNDNGSYMAWGIWDKNSNTNYARMYYCRENSFGQMKEGIYFGAPIFLSSELMLRYGVVNTNNEKYPAVVLGDAINDQFLFLSRERCSFHEPIFVNGYEVLTNSSDKRLKHNIKESCINALERINQISHREFIWNKDNKKEEIGYIAQELEKIDSNYVHKNPQYDEDGNIIDNLYQVNLLPILATATKAIKELNDILEEKNKKIYKLEETIKIIAKKLDIEKECNEILNNNNAKIINSSLNNIIENNEPEIEEKIMYSNNLKIEKPKGIIIDKNGVAKIEE